MARLKKEEVLSLDNIMDIMSNEFTKSSFIKKFQLELNRLKGRDLVNANMKFAQLKMQYEKHKKEMEDTNEGEQDTITEDAISNLGIITEKEIKIIKPKKIA